MGGESGLALPLVFGPGQPHLTGQTSQGAGTHTAGAGSDTRCAAAAAAAAGASFIRCALSSSGTNVAPPPLNAEPGGQHPRQSDAVVARSVELLHSLQASLIRGVEPTSPAQAPGGGPERKLAGQRLGGRWP